MATYGFRLAESRVRFPAPHPISLLLVLFLLILPVSASEVDFDFDDALEDSTILESGTLDVPPYQLFGFSSADEYLAFVDWLGGLQVTSEEEMADVLANSQYSSLNPSVVWQLYSSDDDLQTLAFHSTTGTTYQVGYFTIGTQRYLWLIIYFEGSSSKTLNLYVPVDGSGPNQSLDSAFGININLGDYVTNDSLAEKLSTYVSNADLTTTNSLLSDIVTLFTANNSSSSSNLGKCLTVLRDLRSGVKSLVTDLHFLEFRTDFFSKFDDFVTLLGIPRVLGESTTFGQLFSDWFKDFSVISGLGLDNKFIDLIYYRSSPGGTSVSSIAPSSYMNALSLLSRGLMNSMTSSVAMIMPSSISTALNGNVSSSVPVGSSLADVVVRGFNGLKYFFYGGSTSHFLLQDGTESIGARSLTAYLYNGFLGLNRNMETALVGEHGGSSAISQLVFDSDLNSSYEIVEYKNILSAIVGIGQAVQRPLSQLQAVLANDDDLELRRQTQDQVDAITDNFTGSGGASATLDDISDMAGASSQVVGIFDSGVSVSQFFSGLSNGDNYSFFSQAVSDDLDGEGKGKISTQSDLEPDFDSWLDDIEFDEDGFGYLKDYSFFVLDLGD